MRPWLTLASVKTREGQLELRQRDAKDFLITIDGRVLMTSAAHRSEDALANLGCARAAALPRPRVLVGGLGMGYTLRAALDRLPAGAEVSVVELTEAVATWCRGPLAALTDGALLDRRVKVVVADVARVIAKAPAARYDAVLLDLYEGPHDANNRGDHPLYGATALRRIHACLRPGGVLAVWSEEADAPYERRMAYEFDVEVHGEGRGGRRHTIYVGTKRDGERGPPDRGPKPNRRDEAPAKRRPKR